MLLYKIDLMEDELEEGEIIEAPLLATPLLTHKQSIHNSQCSKTVKQITRPLIVSYPNRINVRKSHVCKSRKKNSPKHNSTDYVRVVKYKVNPKQFRSVTKEKDTTSSKYDRGSVGRTPLSKESKGLSDKYWSYPKRYRDPLITNSDYKIINDSSYEDLLNEYKSIQSQLKNLRENTKYDKSVIKSNNAKSTSKSKPVKRKADIKAPEKSKIVKNEVQCLPSKISKKEKVEVETIVLDDNEDEDDLELLRQEALASRIKLPSESVLCNNNANHLSSDSMEITCDNHDVVDMEFSDDDMCVIEEEILSEQDLNTLKNSILQETNGDYKFDIPESDDSNSGDDNLLELRTMLLAGMKEKQQLNHVTNSDISIVPNVAPVEFNICTPSSENVDSINSLKNITEKVCDNESKEDISELPNSSVDQEFTIQSSDNHVLINDNCDVSSSVHEVQNVSPITSNTLSQPISEQSSIITDVPLESKNVVTYTFPSELSSVIDKENIIEQINLFDRNTLSSDIALQKKLKHKKQIPFIPRELVEPVVIHLGNSSESESDNENDAGKSMLASLDKLIENAKNNVENPSELEKQEVSKSQENNNQCTLNPTNEVNLNAKSETLKMKQLTIFNDLLNKLKSACSTYKEDNKLFSIIKLQANRKKSAFVASQLEVNRLKEQLSAAQKMKNDNQKLMYVANTKLAAVQEVISKKKSLIEVLQTECSKRGSQLFGPSYLLPKFETNSPFKLRQKILGIK